MGILPKHDDPGHAHFVTTNTSHRAPLFLSHDLCRAVLDDVDYYRQRAGYKLLGYVVMPDHLHLLVYPDEVIPIVRIMQLIKRHCAQQIRAQLSRHPTSWDQLGGLVVPPAQLQRAHALTGQPCLRGITVPSLADFAAVSPHVAAQQHEFWQPGFYDFNVFSAAKLEQKLNYIHANPVAWGLVESPEEYLYSSFVHYATSSGTPPIPIDDLLI
jgi:putative transposase